MPFTITIRSNSPTADEDNNKITGTNPQIMSDGKMLQSYIQATNDVDIFEVTKPDGTPLEIGTQVLVTLRNLPQDYDVAVIEDYSNQPEFVIPKGDLEGTSFPTGGTVNTGRVQLSGARLVSGGGGRLVSGGGGRLVSGGGGRLVSGGGGRLVSGGGGRLVSGGGGAIDSALYASWTSSISPIEGQTVSRTVSLGGGRLVSGGGGRLVSGGGGRLVSGGGGEFEGFYRDPDLCTLYTHLAPDLEGDQTKLLDGYPFSDMSFTLLDNNTTSGGDVTFEELGFSHEEMLNRSVAGFSAASGTRTEVVLATVELVGGRTYVAVKGANGAYSAADPYTLQIETTPVLNYSKLLNKDNHGTEKVTTGVTTEPAISYTALGVLEPQTLFVTQPQRLDAIEGAGSWLNKVEPALIAACESEYTGFGAILTVPSSIYDTWDVTPWDTDLANGVTKSIRTAIDDYIYGHPSIRYVVLVGSDEVIPQHRVIDQTVFDNERLYADESGLDLDSALLAGLYDSQILTDDYYVDKSPIPYNSRWLYVPDLAVARLVETPDEIAGTVQKFIDDDGLLAGGSSLVTGQDFMNDGAQRVSDILAAAGLHPKLETPDTWTLADLQADLLGRNVANLNAHFLHYGGVSGLGYQQMRADEDWSGQFLSSAQIADPSTSDLGGKLVFTLGCHAGLSVPDEQAHDGFGDIDLALDVAQAIARQQGVLLASTGYGLGDWYGIAGTEELVGTFADQATTSDDSDVGQPIGLALTAAKRQFFNSMSAVTAYDEKSSIQFTMYGMPQYRLPCTTHLPPAVGGVVKADPVVPPAATFDGAFPTTSFNLTVSDPDGDVNKIYDDPLPLLIEPATDTQTARYITVDGDSQSTTDRPTQPRMVINLGPAGDTPVTAAIVTGGTYADYPDFNPAITSVTSGWNTDAEESSAYADGWSPATPVTVSTVDTPDGRMQQLVVTPGQFLATDVGDNGITGTERVWTDLKVKLVRAIPNVGRHLSHATEGTAPDLIAPTVSSVTLSNVGHQWTATVDATDKSGILRIDVTQIGAESAEPFSRTFTPDPLRTDLYEVPFSLPDVAREDVSVMVAVYDGGNNVTTVTAKGFLVTGSPTGTMILNHGIATTYSPLVVPGFLQGHQRSRHARELRQRKHLDRLAALVPHLHGDLA